LAIEEHKRTHCHHSAIHHFADWLSTINYLQQALAIAEQLGNKREEEAKIFDHDLGLSNFFLV
jgi:hypothetical protein